MGGTSHRKSQKRLVSEYLRITRPFHERLHRIALSLCRDPDLAADLTQEALVRAFKSFDNFRTEAPVLPWLARILRNIHLDLLKSGRARYEIADHQTGHGKDQYEFAPGSMQDPLSCVEQSQLLGWLQEELAVLDKDHQLIIILCDMEGFTYQEAADVAGIPIGTVRSRLSRSREKLRLRLKERMEKK